MKKNSNFKTVNELKNSYAYYIEAKLNKIYAMSKLDTVSLDAMKKNVKNYVYNATYSYQENGQTYYTKKQEFLDNVDSMKDKSELARYCYNVVNKAKDTIAR